MIGLGHEEWRLYRIRREGVRYIVDDILVAYDIPIPKGDCFDESACKIAQRVVLIRGLIELGGKKKIDLAECFC